MENRYKHLLGNQFAKGNKPNESAFKKGNVPWNKGVKGSIKSNSGSFKKGQKGINWMPVDSVTERKDKNGLMRKWIKIQEPNIWIEYAKYIWIQKNGKIPKGLLVHHVDRNSLNDGIENLSLLTRKEHFEIHRIGEMGRKARAYN